jgi:hypothetical protein
MVIWKREYLINLIFYVIVKLVHSLCGWRQNLVTRVNSTNVLDEGLRIGEIGRRMNSKVKLVKIGVYRK